MKNSAKAIVVILSLLAETAAAGQVSFVASGTWTAPAGVTSATVEAWGGGGGGGAATGNPAKGGGGAGGQYASKIVTVVPGNNYAVVVGAGGAGGLNAAGGTGGGSAFAATTVVAAGGAGGGLASAADGVGAAGATAGGVGDMVFAGGNGSSGAGATGVGGAGGGGAGSTGTGGNAGGDTAGTGTATGGGAGANGTSGGACTNAAAVAGGGGCGAYATSPANRRGGDGAAGKVLISYVTPPVVTTNAATGLTAYTATLNGTVDDNGASTTINFEYGLTTAYGSTAVAAPSPLAANSGSTAVSVAVSVLACNTTYHFRATGVNSAGTTNGGDLTFTTSACPPVSFAFTSSPCSDGVPFGMAGQCALVVWSPRTAGQALGSIYITNLNSGVPTRLHPTLVRVRNLQFGLSCHDPIADAGVQANFSATPAALPLCQGGGASPTTWEPPITGEAISFAAGSPSAGPYDFNYDDVGRVELWLRNSATTAEQGSSGAFVVKPAGFILSNIIRSSDNFANPGASNTAGAAFVKAGEAFTATVTAVNAGGNATPNYGKETSPASVKLTPANVVAGMVAPPAIGGTFGLFTSGVATGTAFTWGEVGIITLTPSVGDGDYLGAGDVSGTSSGNLGRFYPEHFDTVITQVAGVPMACPSGLTCPADLNGFVYSGQTFSLTVTAKNAGGIATANYSTTTGFAKPTNLSAFGALGTTTAPGGAGTLGVDSMTAFASGTLTEVAQKYTFTTAATAPTNIYIRAADGEASSLRAINPTTTSVEGGVTVVSGRIKIGNAHGSELLPLPMTATVQYWNGETWVTSTTDSVNTVTAAKITRTNCQGALLSGGACSVTLGTISSVASVPLSPPPYGVFSINLAAPGTGKPGSEDLIINAGDWPNWLPSNTGRATFGVYKGNNYIFHMRENY